LGTAEVESALVTHPACAEAAVVGFPHEIKGQAIFAFVILKQAGAKVPNCSASSRTKLATTSALCHADIVLIVPGLPKTRSGKIMRRILRNIAAGKHDDMGDITTRPTRRLWTCLLPKERRSNLVADD